MSAPIQSSLPVQCRYFAVKCLLRQFEWHFDWFYGTFGNPSQGKKDFIYNVAPRGQITSFPSVITELVIIRTGICSKRNSDRAPQRAGCGDLGFTEVRFWGRSHSTQPTANFWGVNLYFWFGVQWPSVETECEWSGWSTELAQCLRQLFRAFIGNHFFPTLKGACAAKRGPAAFLHHLYPGVTAKTENPPQVKK